MDTVKLQIGDNIDAERGRQTTQARGHRAMPSEWGQCEFFFPPATLAINQITTMMTITMKTMSAIIFHC